MLRRRYRFTLHSLHQAVMISNQPRPTKVSKELHDYYRRHENGRKLLEGVKIFPETKKAEAAGANGQNKVPTSAYCLLYVLLPILVKRSQHLLTVGSSGRRM